MAEPSVVAKMQLQHLQYVREKERDRESVHVCVCAPLGYCIPIIVCPFRSGISINKTTLSTPYWIWPNAENQQRAKLKTKCTQNDLNKRGRIFCCCQAIIHYHLLYFATVPNQWQCNFSLLLVYISLLDIHSFKYNQVHWMFHLN